MGRAPGVLHASASALQPLSALRLDRMAAPGLQAGGRIGTVRAFERTQLQANTDALTGLPNRRHVEPRVRERLADDALYRAKANGRDRAAVVSSAPPNDLASQRHDSEHRNSVDLRMLATANQVCENRGHECR